MVPGGWVTEQSPVPRGLPSGWVQLSATTLRERRAVPGNVAVIGGSLVVDFVLIPLRWASSGGDVGVLVTTMVVLALIAGAVVWLCLPLLAPIGEANFDTGSVRWRRRRLAMSEVARATLLAPRGKGGRATSLTLWIGAVSGPKLPFVLTTGEKVVLDVRRRTLLAEVIRRSSIEYPTDPYDPKGKFTRFNFPGALTREEAMEVVLHPPGPGDPLPISE